jgi:putative drug exporter of the RND superfamily
MAAARSPRSSFPKIRPITIAVGFLLDTLVVRALVTPSVVALLGRWFWWPGGMARAVSRG